MKSRLLTLLGLAVLVVSLPGAEEPRPAVVLQNAHLHYAVAPDGKNLRFIDRATGIDYLKRDLPSPCALVRQQGKDHPATFASAQAGRIVLRFDGAGVEATLRVESHESYIRLAVESVTGEAVESLVFLNVPLTLKGSPEEPFGACALSLNLHTRVDRCPPCSKATGLILQEVRPGRREGRDRRPADAAHTARPAGRC